jgi:hypothetical protein
MCLFGELCLAFLLFPLGYGSVLSGARVAPAVFAFRILLLWLTLWFCARLCGGTVPGGGSWCSRGVYVGVFVACCMLLVCAVRLGFLFGVFLWCLLSQCFFPSRVFLRLFVTAAPEAPTANNFLPFFLRNTDMGGSSRLHSHPTCTGSSCLF